MATYIFPGQGSQAVGMGGELFTEFSNLTAQADAILGYSIADLCLNDPDGNLGKTQYTQPALFIVDALSYLKAKQTDAESRFLLGHSLGEYAALFAANVFDFETGVKLVQKRGELMSQVSGGAMAAVIGLSADDINKVITNNNLETIDVANYNTLMQTVISGADADITDAQTAFEAAECRLYIKLNVSGAFHSRYMLEAKKQFQAYISGFNFSAPQIPVIANLTGLPYEADAIVNNLVSQIDHSVQWVKSIQYVLEQGETEFVEMGPGKVLKGLVAKIKRNQ